jgi:Leucine-rich repeat (LRR) protein
VTQLMKIVHLKCDWVKFVDAEASAPKLEALTEKEHRLQVPLYYKISFESNSLNTQPKYLHVSENFLKDFKVRSLSMRKLNLVSVHDHAFAKENFGTHCRKIDLSFNSLVRLDSAVLEHIDQLEVLILSHNDLQFSENNFAYNRLLSKLDLSFNKIQFLTPKIFYNLERMREIDLRGELFAPFVKLTR